ncbi:MAG: ribonuclease D [Alphaproteobacteria bacterium]|nr:ribonuclease D [Alphaproteobacteria bacterium]
MIINNNDELKQFCDKLHSSRFLAIDTEFIRDRTYWPRLCLIQVAGENDVVGAIDPLADDIDLSPLLNLLYDEKILKVFHAARQDLEIFFHMTGKVPSPIADTQVMGMVCGFGESVSYENIVAKLAKGTIDKSSRFTDWALRPLSEKQLHYALDDVRFLRPVFEKLEKKLKELNRADWIEEEMNILREPSTYKLEPDQAWKRLKIKMDKPKFFTLVKDLCAWREREAQTIDIPRNRVIRDEALMEIVHHVPRDAAELGRVRGLSAEFAKNRLGSGIIEVIKNAQSRAPDALPDELRKKHLPSNLGAVVDMLKVLLRLVAEENDVATKLISNASDLDMLAENDAADVLAMKGWRYDVFGKKAVALKQGKLALKLNNNKIEFIDV